METRTVVPDAGPFETFPNPAPQRGYIITHHCTEWTSICPVTGAPDFGKLEIQYIGGERLVELKSLKLWLQSFRDKGIYYEQVTNLLLDELVKYLSPRWMRIEATFTVRGGIYSVIVAEHGKRS